MLVLAIDTATDVVTVGLVTVTDADQPNDVLAEQALPAVRRHGERLMPAVLAVCEAAGHRLASVDAVVCGAGPGPFTGLRVGLVSAASLGDALGVPVYGVCSLDAVAAQVPPGDSLLVVSDARRRELYWATYVAPGVEDPPRARLASRVEGPAVDAPAVLVDRIAELGVRRIAGPVASEYSELFGLAEYPEPGAGLNPSPAGLVAVAEADLRSGREPKPLEPYYLRRPDAVPPGARKRVTVV